MSPLKQPSSSAAGRNALNDAAVGDCSWSLLLLNWLVPGAGWIVRGRLARGLISSALVFITFILGLALHGGVSWPSWSPGTDAFNLINNFTFIIQFGAGLPALASLIADQYKFTPLGGIPQHAYYELGGYYMVVAGAINYFSTCNLYDRLMSRGGHFAEQESGEVRLEKPIDEAPRSDGMEYPRA